MSKPLTIEELKSLKVGDWVWLTNQNGLLGTYVAKADASYEEDDKTFNFDSLAFSQSYPYSDYGKTWLAYKNKEQAETKKYKLNFNSQGGWEVRKYMPAYYQPLFRADTKEEAKLILAKEYNVEVEDERV